MTTSQTDAISKFKDTYAGVTFSRDDFLRSVAEYPLPGMRLLRGLICGGEVERRVGVTCPSTYQRITGFDWDFASPAEARNYAAEHHVDCWGRKYAAEMYVTLEIYRFTTSESKPAARPQAQPKFVEAELYEPVKHWLGEQGFVVHPEVQEHDIVAIRGDDLWVVELKVGCTASLTRQCYRANLKAHVVYGVVRANPSNKSFLAWTALNARNPNMGLARLIDGEIRVVIHAQPVKIPRDEVGYVWLKRKVQNQEPDTCVGGMPTVAGEGPAIRTLGRLRVYLRDNPKASWSQIHKDVPNQYCSPSSMAGGMRNFVPDGVDVRAAILSGSL